MPHSISPELTPAEEMSQPASQADNVKPEAETQEDVAMDVAMDDAPTAVAAETAKVKLEEMFDDADSDSEFASSAPAPTSQEDASQPAPMYAPASQGPY